MIVVDASLAAKWLFDEPESAAARRFAADHAGRLCAPDLLFSEVAGVAVRRANMAPELRDESLDILRIWAIYGRDGVVAAHRVTTELLHQAALLALTLTHPLADCVYLALARQIGCDLATCDRKFCARISDFDSRVKLLETYAA